jgi:GT2 family glycosyltransferase
VVLASLYGQTFRDFDVTVSDQTADGERYVDSIEIQTLARALRRRGHRVEFHHHLPRRGLAEQRQFLLDQSRAPYAHFLDDDVLLDPETMERMLSVIREEGCGFVGCPATGLDYLDDVRPHQQAIELWHRPVEPEAFGPDAIPWDRHKVNNAANPLHLEARLWDGARPIRYKIAWVGGANVLFDREKLLAVGGFGFWDRLPPQHAGERWSSVPPPEPIRRLRHAPGRHLPPRSADDRRGPQPERDRAVCRIARGAEKSRSIGAAGAPRGRWPRRE